MAIVIYGIKACSTMKKAFSKLDELGVAYEFHDYKKQGIDNATVQRWVNELGIDKVLNKRGTTWRKLFDAQKLAADASTEAAIELLIDNTSMIKRPIVEGEHNGQSVLLCGFNDAEFEAAFN
ncbi:arsenate reductase [Psychrobacter raelei]|uniref:arsenate reductase n=1 Tax=Psychrobacter raelei TaxID=2565531 RepID=UPI003F64816C